MPTFPFAMQPQARTNWCWAATAVSVQLYYYPNDRLTQCVQACNTTGRGDCCEDLPNDAHPCNVAGDLGLVLHALGRLDSTVLRPATLIELANAIVARRPVCIRVTWWRGGAHFMVCAGYVPTTIGLYLLIHDPWFGTSWVPHATFPTVYQNKNGTWAATCFTKP
jgi:Papain-like cysteine protease AvrRpt2